MSPLRTVVLAPLLIWGGLLLLLGLTIGYAHLSGAPAKPWVMLGISATQAVLVALLFMQLRRAAAIVRIAALTGVVWASFLYLFAFADFLTR